MTVTSRYQALIASGALSPDSYQHTAVEALQRLSDALEGYSPPSRIQAHVLALLPALRKPAPRGLYLHGDVGRGKSMLMELFYEEAPTPRKLRIHFHAFMRDIHAQIHQWRQDHPDAQGEDADPILPIARSLRDRYTLICLDEFEVHDIADAMILGRLLTLLFKRGVVAVLTSNRAPKALYPHGLQRDRFLKFVELMLEKIDVLALQGPTDYRLEKLKALQHTYLTPDTADTRTRLHQACATLSQNQPFTPTHLSVQGRTVTLPRTTQEAAYCSFDELCATPLASADYIALAERFSTLCLESIPLLTAEKRNEARRFVMLIDALYDHRTKLICTAAAAPEALYPSGTGSFEFSRTVSRLQEMQSESYLSLPHRTLVEA